MLLLANFITNGNKLAYRVPGEVVGADRRKRRRANHVRVRATLQSSLFCCFRHSKRSSLCRRSDSSSSSLWQRGRRGLRGMCRRIGRKLKKRTRRRHKAVIHESPESGNSVLDLIHGSSPETSELTGCKESQVNKRLCVRARNSSAAANSQASQTSR